MKLLSDNNSNNKYVNVFNKYTIILEIIVTDNIRISIQLFDILQFTSQHGNVNVGHLLVPDALKSL